MPESNLITQWGSYFLKGNFRLVRNTFALAGQDSFTDPPAQNTDLFSQLLNVQPPVKGDLNRRWGYGLQTPAALPSLVGLSQVVPVGLYQNVATNARQLVFDSANNPIVATSEQGAITNTGIFTPIGANPTRMLNARSYGYFSSGAKADYKKWDGATTVTNWGIDVNNVAGTVNGPFGPTNVTDLGSGGGGGIPGQSGPNSPSAASSPGSPTWNNTNKVFVADGVAATVTLTSTNFSSDFLAITGYGFSIPNTATVTGIVVQTLVKRGTAAITDNSIRLLKNGSQVGTDHAGNFDWGTSFAYHTYGSASDLWGTTWSPADINNANFGMEISAFLPGNNNSIAFVDYVSITVYYTTPGGGGGSWTNPNNIKVADGAVATAPVSTSPTSALQALGFGFAAFGNIQGIQVDILARTTALAPNVSLILNKAAVTTGLAKTVTVNAPGLTYYSAGGANDLWGATWTATDINSANFGVQFTASLPSGSATISVDFIRITVYTTVGAITLGAPVGGAITLSVGRIYTFAFQNSLTGHLSNIAPFSLTSGPLTAQNQPLSGIPVSLDPQVDSKVIMATADGGDETTLYFVAQIANSTTTYTDATPEATLLLNNIYLDQDATGNTLGVADNDPPPVGTQYPINHRGRVYMATGNALYYSKAESDLVTATENLTGKYEEAWPPLNYFSLASEAETITGLLSDGQVLYIGTNTRVLRLYGDGPSTFQEPEALFKHTGVLNQDVWKMVFLQGNPLGAMWLTPDYRVLGSDFNTYQDIGQPIQNVLDTINTTAASKVAWASYVGISNWNLFVLAVPTGGNTQPDTFLVFDLRGKQWFVWQPTDLMLGGIYNITLAGTPQFLTVANSGTIWNWGPQFSQDRMGVTPTNIPVTIESSWQDFTDAAARKYLNEIELIVGDPTLTVTIEGASTTAEFSAPDTVIASSALFVKPRGEYFVPLAGRQTKDRFYRYRLVSNASGVGVLRGINIQGGVVHRV